MAHIMKEERTKLGRMKMGNVVWLFVLIMGRTYLWDFVQKFPMIQNNH